jgi:hypothetical protein
MASASRAKKADPVMGAAVDYFAARSHSAWRRRLLQTDPKQKGKPRMRQRGGVMVDVNQPWAELHPKAKADNMRAARDAYRAVVRYPTDREAAAAFVHACWIKRNKGDASQPKALFKPYAHLPEVEKDKDRAHVDNMKKAIAAVRKPARKKPKPKRSTLTKAVRVDTRAWRRLEAAAKSLSSALGREVAPELLLDASVETVAALCKAIAADARSKDA